MLECYVFVFTAESMSLSSVDRPYHCHHRVHGLIHFMTVITHTSTSVQKVETHEKWKLYNENAT
jgi:hypothetical protein